jgi:hypothetical protein
MLEVWNGGILGDKLMLYWKNRRLGNKFTFVEILVEENIFIRI